jgi:hypothetical protein
MIGVGKVKQYGNVLDKPLNKGKTEVSIYLSIFLDLLPQMHFLSNTIDLAFLSYFSPN